MPRRQQNLCPNAGGIIAYLSQFYGFDVVETGGQLRFVPRGRPYLAQIAADTLVITDRNAEDISFIRAQETELPRALKWRLLMPDEDYGSLSVEARRITTLPDGTIDPSRADSEWGAQTNPANSAANTPGRWARRRRQERPARRQRSQCRRRRSGPWLTR